MLYIQETEGERGREGEGLWRGFRPCTSLSSTSRGEEKGRGKWSNETRTDAWRGNKSLTEAVRNFENSAAADAAGRGEPLGDEGGQVRRAKSETTSERKPDTWSPSLSPSRGWLPRAPARGALIKDCSLELGRDQIDLFAVPCAMEGEGAGSSEVNDLIGAVSLFARQRRACIARWSFLVFSSLLPSSLSSSYLFGICAIRHALRLSLRISELVQGVSVPGLGHILEPL